MLLPGKNAVVRHFKLYTRQRLHSFNQKKRGKYLLIRLTDHHARLLCRIPRNIHHCLILWWPLAIRRVIDGKPQTVTPLDERLPQHWALLANPTSEDQCVYLTT